MKNAVYLAFGGLLTIFLLLNIVSSQSISSLYFDLVKHDASAAVSFLQQIRSLPDFEKMKRTFSFDVLHRFTVAQFNHRREIHRLEALLDKNSNARDVLYNLFILHEQQGNSPQAQEYLRRAKEVDPNIK